MWAAREGFEHDESTERVLVRKTPIAAGGATPAAFFRVSIAAMSWAFELDLKPATLKFLLVALADNADAMGELFPSITALSRKTSLDRKTVIRGIDHLESIGLLEDTGKRVGRTRQTKVYDLIGFEVVERAAVKSSVDDPLREVANSTAHGTGPKSGTVPSTTAKSTVFPSKGSQSRTPSLLAPLSPPHTPPLTPHTTHPCNPQEPSQNQEGDRELRAKRSPATAKRLQPEFDLTQDRRTVALEERVDPEREFKRFRDHWLAASGANARKHDWDAAWRNWCRKAADMQVNAPRLPGVPTPADPNAPKWTAVLIAVDRVKQADGNGGVTWADARREICDDIAHQAIEQLGGYKRIADRDRFTTSELKRRFAELYEHFRALDAGSRARTRLESP